MADSEISSTCTAVSLTAVSSSFQHLPYDLLCSWRCLCCKFFKLICAELFFKPFDV